MAKTRVRIPPWTAFSVDRKIEQRGVRTRLQPEGEREKGTTHNFTLLGQAGTWNVGGALSPGVGCYVR